MPLKSVSIMLGTQKKVEMAPALNFNNIPSDITGTHQKTTFYVQGSMYNFQKLKETSESVMKFDNTSKLSRELSNHGYGSVVPFNRQRLGIRNTTVLYEDIALPDAVLHDYYSKVLY